MKLFPEILLLLLFFLMYGNMKAGNCIPVGSTLYLTRQSEIDSFRINYPDCSNFDGNLTISGSDVVNLDSLIGLKRIPSNLWIYNTNLHTLKGLDSLSTIYGTRIENNSLLNNLTGLSSLDSASSFEIYSNENLTNFIGLHKIKFVGKLDVRFSSSLIDFHGFESLEHVNNLDVFYNPSLINFNGLNSLTSLSSILLFDNSILNFYGLHNIISCYEMNISDNYLISNLEGLTSLRSTMYLIINQNESLKNLVGLNSIDTIFSLLNVQHNSSLINLKGLDNLNYIGDASIDILYNPSLCSINDINNNLKSINGSVQNIYIFGNENLSCCNVLNKLFSSINWKSIVLENNAPGCNDTTEIRIFPNQNCCTTKYTLIKDTICSNEYVVFNNQNYSTDGTYYDTIANNGIDSIIILQLKVYNKSYHIINTNLCIGQSFTLSNGKVITSDGVYNDTLRTIFGCDSIIEYHLNFLNNITTNQNAIVCKGKTYTLPKGNVVSTSGIYRDTLRASFGCDSIVITNLSFTNPTPFINNVTICSGKTFVRPNGNIVSISGTYYDTIRAASTCDSIVITNLTINPYLQSSQISTVCLGKSFILPDGRSVNQSGIYKDTIKNNNGCDSIIITNLFITNPTPSINTISICDGQTYTLPNGNKVSIAATYTDTIRQTNTCDSVIITDLSVFPNTFTVSLKPSDTIDVGSSIELNPIYGNMNAISWNWSPSDNLNCTTCERPIASPILTNTYTLNAIAQNGCEDTAQTTIIVRAVDVYIPSAFSPNGDGVNDVLDVFTNNPKSYHFKIFNRWGELVFESTDVNNKWNGLYTGENCPVDSYAYTLDVVFQNDKQYNKKGAVLLLR
ncbi:MAG: gliding motility-associated C-terminal domain-containing protein [Chitinophagales bacterium]